MKTINQDIKEENFRPVYLLYGCLLYTSISMQCRYLRLQ